MRLKIKLSYIANVDKLIHMIEESQGDIRLCSTNNLIMDLKQDKEALQILKHEISQNNSVILYLYNGDDYFRFIYFLMGGCA